MASRYDLHLHRWVKRNPCSFSLAVAVQELAVLAKGAFEVMCRFRSGELEEKLPSIHSVPGWLALYNEPGRITAVVAQHVADIEDGRELVQDMRYCRRTFGNPKRGPKLIKEAIQNIPEHKIREFLRVNGRCAQRNYHAHLGNLAAELEGDASESYEWFGKAIETHPEMLFYLRVVLPCLLLYQKHPILLLRQARRSSGVVQSQAIEDLVRLDPYIHNHPDIQAWEYQSPGPIRADRQRLLAKWRLEGLNTGKFTWTRWLEVMGGLVQAVSQVLGWYYGEQGGRFFQGRANFEAERIRELFQAAHQDRAGRRRPDVDEQLASLQTASWRRMLAKYRRLWMPVLRAREIPA